MKLGNTSQSIVPVPNFYLTRSLKEMDTFNTTYGGGKKYFRETDLFRKTRDINISNNPRNRNRKHENYNKTKFIPVHRMGETMQSSIPLETVKYDSSDSEDFEYQQQVTQGTKYNSSVRPKVMDQTQYNHDQISEYHSTLNQRSVRFRDEMKKNFDNLLDSLGKKFEVGKYNSDTAENYFKSNAETYSLITTFNQNNDNEATKFKKDIKSKIESLTSVTDDRREKIINDIDTKDSQQQGFTLPFITAKQNFHKTLDTFANKGSEIGTRLNFYRTFGNDHYMPSTREEFFKPREKREEYLIDESKYQSSKARKMFCEDYDHQEFIKKYNIK
jgi:hypothetical protein